MFKPSKKFILISTPVILVFVFTFIFLINSQNEQIPINAEDYLIERQNMPKTNWPRVLEENKISPEKKEVTNHYDGYKITIPQNWHIPDQTDTLAAQRISVYTKEAINQLNTAPENISQNNLSEVPSILVIYSLSKNTTTDMTTWLKEYSTLFSPLTKNFVQTRVNGMTAYKNSAKFMGEEGLIENSLGVSYALENKEGNKVYILACSSDGQGYAARIELCEEAVQTFTLLR